MLHFTPRQTVSSNFPRPGDMPEALHLLLTQRGISSAREAEEFLHPSAEQLHDPMLLSDMVKAVAEIRGAMEPGKHICVYGDYDVDGVCASSILYLYLTSLGADVEVYLPSRHREGYGLNDDAMRELAQRCALMVTVDCGISCAPQIELAKSLGMRCVVTDHHRPGDLLPDCPTVNPLLNGYPFPTLCGAGVAFKLVCAMGGIDAALPYADLAALATVADLVSLTGENRVLVSLGLEKINREPRTGVRALIRAAGLEGRSISAGNIAFQMAPRLNAGGRLGDAKRSFELLVSMDELTADGLAAELEDENTRRRDIEHEITAKAEEQLRDFDFPAHRILVAAGNGWNPGVIGLAASKVTEKYHYPSIMLAVDGEEAVGSCRSIPNVDIYEALCSVSDLFTRFGGHKQAAGLSMPSEKIPELQRRLDEYLADKIPPRAYIPGAEYDLRLDFPVLTEAFTRQLEGLQPTGFGNPSPVFLTRAVAEDARGVGADGVHLKLRLAQDGRRMDGICFQAGDRAGTVRGRECDALYTPKLNAFNGRISVQLETKILEVPADADSFLRNRQNEALLQSQFLTEMLYNREYIRPDVCISMDALREELRKSPQGTLIVAADLRTAADIADQLEGLDFDAYTGRYPDDPRCFNALCAYPVGNMPAHYRRIVLAGVPDFTVNAARLEGVPAIQWTRELPDRDGLRGIIRTLMETAKRPCSASSREQLTKQLSADAGCTVPAARGALTVLEELELIRVHEGENPCFKLYIHKTEPEGSAAFRRMQLLRGIGTEGGLSE